MATLIKASNEWATRPADQRFKSLADLHSAVTDRRDRSRTATVAVSELRAKVVDGTVYLNGRADRTAALTHWSFGQLSRFAGAPPSYLRQLPAPLAAECLNTGLVKYQGEGEDSTAKLLLSVPVVSSSQALSQVVESLDSPPPLTLRGMTSDRYSRIWDADITSRLIRLAEHGWQPAPAAFDGSRGLYASAHDMFAFMVDNDRRIFERGPGGGLSRGFFAWNSEVGAASFGIMTFLYEYVCGNHRVWGASNVSEVRIRHVGDADERAFSQMAVELRKYADSSAADDELKIQRAGSYQLGANKDEVLDAVFGLKVPGLTRARIVEAYQLAEEHSDWYGNPRSAWGLAGGLTEIARDLPHADERVTLDRAAGKVMEMAF